MQQSCNIGKSCRDFWILLCYNYFACFYTTRKAYGGISTFVWSVSYLFLIGRHSLGRSPGDFGSLRSVAASSSKVLAFKSRGGGMGFTLRQDFIDRSWGLSWIGSSIFKMFIFYFIFLSLHKFKETTTSLAGCC